MNEKVRWGTLGCARVFERRMTAGFLAASECAELIAIASRSEEKAKAAAEKYHIPRAYGSYEALLEDPDIEAVYIPLPNDLHAEWTLRAIAAGKHILCDKPLALTLEDAHRMADAAKAAGVRLMEGFMWRHHPQHRRVKEIVQSGEIGAVTHFRGVFGYPAAFDPKNIRFNPEHGGGSLWDVAVYPVNAARYFMESEPHAVYASAKWDEATGVDYHISALLEFNGSRTAYIDSGFDTVFTSRYEIVGDTGVVAAERAFQVGEAGVTLTIRVGDNVRTEFFPHMDQYGLEIRDFCHAVRNPELSLAPGEDGVAQTRVMTTLARSAKEKHRISLE